MAVVNGYATLAQLKAELGIPVADTDDDAVLEAALTAASRSIDDWCGRRFYSDSADTTRYFTPTRHDRVELVGPPTAVDVQSVTTVTVDLNGNGTYSKTWTEGTDFALAPRGNAADSIPYTRLHLLPTGTASVPVGLEESVKIVGTFGWASTPEPVTRACLAWSSQVFKQIREAPFGVSSFDIEGGAIRLSRYLPGNVEMLLRPYRRVGTVAGYA